MCMLMLCLIAYLQVFRTSKSLLVEFLGAFNDRIVSLETGQFDFFSYLYSSYFLFCLISMAKISSCSSFPSPHLFQKRSDKGCWIFFHHENIFSYISATQNFYLLRYLFYSLFIWGLYQDKKLDFVKGFFSISWDDGHVILSLSSFVWSITFIALCI